MKNIVIYVIAFFLMGYGCRKDNINKSFISPVAPAPTPPYPITNENSFRVFAGDKNLYVNLPTDSVNITAYSNQVANAFAGLTFRWTMVKGPSDVKIRNPNAASTVVSGLKEGIYLFEVKLSGLGSVEARDTQAVIVGNLSANPKKIDLGGRIWESGPFWNRIIIDDVYAIGAANNFSSSTYFELYIMTSLTNKQWQRVDTDGTLSSATNYGYLLEPNSRLTVFDLTSNGQVGDSLYLQILHN